MGTHISIELEKYIGRKVKITSFDGDIFIGYFDHSKQDWKTEYESNLPYALRNVTKNGKRSDGTWHFYKSHIKDISLYQGV